MNQIIECFISHLRKKKLSIPKFQLDCQVFFCHMFAETKYDFDSFLEIVNSFSYWSRFIFHLSVFSWFLIIVIKRRYIFLKPRCEDIQTFPSSLYNCGSNKFQKSPQLFLRWINIGCILFLYYCSMMKVLVCWWRWVVRTGNFRTVWNRWNVM